MSKFEEEVYEQARLVSIAEFLIQMIGKRDKFQQIAKDLVEAYNQGKECYEISVSKDSYPSVKHDWGSVIKNFPTPDLTYSGCFNRHTVAYLLKYRFHPTEKRDINFFGSEGRVLGFRDDNLNVTLRPDINNDFTPHHRNYRFSKRLNTTLHYGKNITTTIAWSLADIDRLYPVGSPYHFLPEVEHSPISSCNSPEEAILNCPIINSRGEVLEHQNTLLWLKEQKERDSEDWTKYRQVLINFCTRYDTPKKDYIHSSAVYGAEKHLTSILVRCLNVSDEDAINFAHGRAIIHEPKQ